MGSSTPPLKHLLAHSKIGSSTKPVAYIVLNTHCMHFLGLLLIALANSLGGCVASLGNPNADGVSNANTLCDDPWEELKLLRSELLKEALKMGKSNDDPPTVPAQGQPYSTMTRPYYYSLAVGLLPLEYVDPAKLKGKHILDAGTGLGLTTLDLLIDFQIDIHGIDIHLKDRLQNKPSPVHKGRDGFYNADMMDSSTLTSLCPRSHCFDAILANKTFFEYEIKKARHDYLLSQGVDKKHLDSRYWREYARDKGAQQIINNEFLRAAFKTSSWLLKAKGQVWAGGISYAEDADLLKQAAQLAGFQLIREISEHESRNNLLTRLVPPKTETDQQIAEYTSTQLTRFGATQPILENQLNYVNDNLIVRNGPMGIDNLFMVFKKMNVAP